MDLKKYQSKILNIANIIEKFDIPAFDCSKEFYLRNNINPTLAVVLTSNDPGCVSYTKGIKRFSSEQGVNFLQFSSHDAESLKKIIIDLNANPKVHGIIIMYPTGYGIKDTVFMNMVDPLKDVEGLHYSYLGYLVQYEKFRDAEQLRKLVIPPTAKGILSIFKRYYIYFEEFRKQRGFYPENLTYNPFELEGKRITIINDSLAVGRSLALMMLNENAYVQICHQYTPFDKTLESVKLSDIVISAVPSDKFVIPTEFVPENSILFDISFNGNFDYPSVFEKCLKIAPRWDLVEKGNRINDMTLNRLISNLFYLVNCSLPEEEIKKMKEIF